MKKSVLISSALFLFILSSCGTPITGSSEDASLDVTSENPTSEEISVEESKELSSEEESSDKSSEIISEDPIEYHPLFEGVSVDVLPTILKEETDLHFDYDDIHSTLYYKIGQFGNYEEVEKGGSVKISYINTGKIASYPTTTAVKPDPTGTGGSDKCFSQAYYDNIYRPLNYILTQKMPVLYLKLEKEDGTEIENVYTYPLEKDYDLSSIPVVCLNANHYDLFDYNNGFYNNITKDIKARAYIEYFDATYDEYFHRDTQVKLGGNWSKGYPQRTLNINFNKDRDGNKNDPVDCHIFKETKKENSDTERLTGLTRFRLHNGGNCFEAYTGYNDAMLQEIMNGTNVSTTSFRPAIVFINGEYWGTMSIREHYSDTYFKDNYDIKKDNVIMYELQGNWKFDDGNDANAQEYLDELLSYVDNHDFTNDAVYEEFISDYIDVDSLIDLFIIQSYGANWDFVGNTNNLKMWRVDTPNNKNPYADGRWRFCLHDIDFGCDCEDNNLYLSNGNLSQNRNLYKRFPMYNKLAQNKKFRMRFLARAEELIASNLSADNVCSVLSGIYQEVKPFKVQSQIRWGQYPETFEHQYENNVNSALRWMAYRSNNYIRFLKDELKTWGSIS